MRWGSRGQNQRIWVNDSKTGPIGSRQKTLENMANKGSVGHCHLGLKIGQGQKLRRKILLRIGYYFCNFHFPKHATCLEAHVGWTSGNVHDPQKPSFLTLDPPSYSKHVKKIHNQFWNIWFREISDSQQTNILKQKRVPTNPWDPFYQILRIWSMG